LAVHYTCISYLDTNVGASSLQSPRRNRAVPARERTYENLKSAVLSGRFSPGERLTEEHLAEALGVSRTPVREALHKLESEGLIKPLPTRGFYVSRESGEEMKDLFELRCVLEAYALRLVCPRMNEEVFHQLQDFIEKAEDAFQRKDNEEIFHWNTRFHDALNDVVAHKPRLHQLIADMRKFVLRYRKDTLHYLSGAKRSIDGHRKILLALRLQDPDICERVMREHVQEAMEDALQTAEATE
jgi:DNA-binding GntR family transcriptional regulator